MKQIRSVRAGDVRKKLTSVPAMICVAWFALTFLSGCGKDARIRRQASYVNVVTQTAAREFKEAATETEKVKIADTYFERMPKHTQIMEDYLLGKKPSTPAPK